MKSIEVVAAIIQRQTQNCCCGNPHVEILATQRGYGDLAGGWEFPGGKVEPGEAPEDAIVREILEELDAKIEVESLLVTVDHDYPTFHLTMHCFLSHLAADHVELLEHSAARWVDAKTVDEVAWLPADVKVVDAIKAAGILG